MSGLRRPHSVIRRSPGAYVAGVYQPAPEPAPVGILASLQPASAMDYERTAAGTEGRRYSALWRLYTAERLSIAGDGDQPGDIVLDSDGRRLLLIGRADRNVLQSSVSHYRYLAVSEIEHGTGENPL